MPSPENPNWIYDCPPIDDFSVTGAVFASPENGAFLWGAHDLGGSSSASMENGGFLLDTTASKESGSQKRARSETTCAPGSKACREKIRRDKLNDKFMELAAILDPVKASKMDKAAILSDAVGAITRLRNEAQKLKDSNHSLKEKIEELKSEKNELRDEKQRLKEEKTNLEQQIKVMSMQPSYLPFSPMMPFYAPVPANGNKLMMPYMGHPGFMFQFQAPTGGDDKSELPPAA